MAVVSERGQLFTSTDTLSHTCAHTHTSTAHTEQQTAPPLTSVHPCVSNWNTAAFPPGWNGRGLPYPGTLFLTGLASLPPDCPHGFSRCHETPAASAKSTVLRPCQVPDGEWISMKWLLWQFRQNKKVQIPMFYLVCKNSDCWNLFVVSEVVFFLNWRVGGQFIVFFGHCVTQCT